MDLPNLKELNDQILELRGQPQNQADERMPDSLINAIKGMSDKKLVGMTDKNPEQEIEE